MSMSTSGASLGASTSHTSSSFAGDYVFSAYIALDCQNFGEEPPRPQDRIAALARMRGNADGAALGGIESRDQGVDKCWRERMACRPGRSRRHRFRAEYCLRPDFKDVLKPFAKSSFLTNRTSKPARACSIFEASRPVTTITGEAWLLSAVSTVRRMSGWPPTSTSNLFSPMREESPAASTMAAICGACEGHRYALLRAAGGGSGFRSAIRRRPSRRCASPVTGIQPAAAPARNRSRCVWGSGRSRAGPRPSPRPSFRAAGGCRDRPAFRNARSRRPPARWRRGSRRAGR